MTFSIVARCPETGQVGVCIATGSPSVGNRCIFAAAGVGALTFQACAEPRLGMLGLNLLKAGFSAHKVLAELASTDPGHEWRQIGIVDAQGRVAVHTGSKNGNYAGHVVGDGYVALGNVLEGPDVPKGIAAGYEHARGEKFEERLMRAIETGRNAGGQGRELGQTSSAILTHDRLPFAYVDLRVDHSLEPIAELRRIFDWHKPYFDYFVERADNYEILGHRAWIKQQGYEREYGIPQPKKPWP
jgi:uncharacterized Ntn-hydrolase superfamily protein